MTVNNEVQDLLSFDSLTEAEKITGQSSKEDKATADLGVALHILVSEQKKEELALRNDTYWSMPFLEAVSIYHDLGFVTVYENKTVHEGQEETHLILWHSDGLVLHVDSHKGNLNKALMYYNWEHESMDIAYKYTSSGHYNSAGYEASPRRRIWVGEHNASEAVRNTLDILRSNGQFLPEWVERPFMWFIPWWEERRLKNDDAQDAYTQGVIEALPDDVKRALN